MALWAIIPELIVGALILVLLPLGAFTRRRARWLPLLVASSGWVAALFAAGRMLGWSPRAVFEGTYALDPFAVFFKLVALVATLVALLAAHSRFEGHPHQSMLPALFSLVCLGAMGLSASQDLVLIALFLQLVSVGAYTLAALDKRSARAVEGAVKLFLFTAASGAVMIYGLSLLYGLSGTLQLPRMALALGAAPVGAVAAALALVLVGYGFKASLVPFHAWTPDTYQGAPGAISGFLAVVPKAAALAVMTRTFLVALPPEATGWPSWLGAVAAVTMTVGNLLALRQSSLKRLLAYSSIAQAGFMTASIAAASRVGGGVTALLVYLAVYVFMELGAFISADALERRIGTDELGRLDGLGRQAPVSSATLGLSVLSLAGIPPLGGFLAKTLVFVALLDAGLGWLAAVMAVNVVVSLYYYARVLARLYLHAPHLGPLPRSPAVVREGLLLAALGALATGIVPAPWVALSDRAAQLLRTSPSAQAQATPPQVRARPRPSPR